MHRKQNTDLIPADTELERTLRSLRKIKKAENSTMAMKDRIRMKYIEKQLKGLQSLILLRTSGSLLFKTSTLQSGSQLLMQIILNLNQH